MGLVMTFGSGGGGWSLEVDPVHADFTAEPTSGPAPLEVLFDASASSGPIDDYGWNFGAGAMGVTAAHTCTTRGTRGDRGTKGSTEERKGGFAALGDLVGESSCS